jgi:cell division protein ZipA
MQANWSLILNILLLVMVVVAIFRLVNTRRQSINQPVAPPLLEPKGSGFYDEVIAVRKINTEKTEEPVLSAITTKDEAPIPTLEAAPIPTVVPKQPEVQKKTASTEAQDKLPIVMFLLAKENRQFVGYELLQTLLSAGLRFGEGQLFHRHQFSNGQGPVLCSLAAATESGVFDLQNIGAFSVRGLCLFMHASYNSTIDEERFTVLLDTARQLSEGLDALLLDDKRRPLTEQRIARYYQLLNLYCHCP